MKLPDSTAVPLDNATLDRLIAFAGELADVAGSVILPHFRSQVTVDHKPGRGGFDPVTVADRAAETAMRELITMRFPDHGILGEEHGARDSASGLTWVLDPVDGTRAFIAGIPVWGTLIALHNGERSVIGVADQPYLRERYIGVPQQTILQTPAGTHVLHTRPCVRLSDATLMTTSPDIFRTVEEKDAFDAVSDATRMTRYGADCYAYCMLASGFVDVVVESGLQPYDIQALVPIVEGAGGCVTNWRGGNSLHHGQVIALGDSTLLEQVVACLSGASRS
jgi:myo-inositol-1(or 4)-monophosphatase